MSRSLRWIAALLYLLTPLSAHLVSLSRGELTIHGQQAHFRLEVPAYEIQHVPQPERSLLAAFQFGDARLMGSRCAFVAGSDRYVCEADYQLGSAEPRRLDVSCALTSILVPTHVHWLRITGAPGMGQAVFDANFGQGTVSLGAKKQLPQGLRGLRLLLLPGSTVAIVGTALALRGKRWRGLGGAILGACTGVVVITQGWWLPPLLLIEVALGIVTAYAGAEWLLGLSKRSWWWALPLGFLIACFGESQAISYAVAPAGYLAAMPCCALVLAYLRTRWLAWASVASGVVLVGWRLWF